MEEIPIDSHKYLQYIDPSAAVDWRTCLKKLLTKTTKENRTIPKANLEQRFRCRELFWG
jgi:predicted metal-dependent peptidase